MLRGKGKVSVAKAMATFNIGDKVVITPRALRSGLPHMRYANRHGKIVEKRGKAYMVEVADMNATKRILEGTVHLQLSA